MDTDAFYVELYSNASLNYFPDNTLSTFRVQLAQSLPLVGQWKCALLGISFNNNYVADTGGRVLLQTSNNPETGLGVLPYNLDFQTPVGVNVAGSLPGPSLDSPYQTSVFESKAMNNRQLIQDLNAFLGASSNLERQSEKTRLGVSYVTKDRRHALGVLTIVTPPDATLILEGKLARTLGLAVAEDSWTVFPSNGIFTYPTARPTISRQSPQYMFVYTNIVQPRFIGDALASCLRTIRVPTNDPNRAEELESLEFLAPHYLPVSTSTLHVIDIRLCYSTGQPILFTSGPATMVSLHFIRT
jgi:hypothetical protein